MGNKRFQDTEKTLQNHNDRQWQLLEKQIKFFKEDVEQELITKLEDRAQILGNDIQEETDDKLTEFKKEIEELMEKEGTKLTQRIGQHVEVS